MLFREYILDPILNIGVKAATSAGKVLLRFLDSLDRLAVKPKGRHDFVSEADQISEETIIEIVRKHYPGHGILSEESGFQAGSGSDKDQIEWIIDPLDGTLNYLHNHPDFAISVAVRKNRIVEHGIIFDPMRNDLYTATRNKGAQLNGKRLHVTHAKKLQHSTVALGSPHPGYACREQWLEQLSALMSGMRSVRMSGSAALDMAYVAAGRIDGFFQPSLNVWDIAAGSLLVREAKGLVADCDGEQNYLDNGCVVAAGIGIFTQLLGLVQRPCGSSLPEQNQA